MACEKAVIVSDRAGCALDLVEEGVNGFIFNSGDERQLTEILNTLAKDSGRIKKMGIMSGRKIQSWTYEVIISAILEVRA